MAPDIGGSGGHGKAIRFPCAAPEERAHSGEAPEDLLPHGRLLRLPWVMMPFDGWREIGVFENGRSEPAPLGVGREFLIVWPPDPEPTPDAVIKWHPA